MKYRKRLNTYVDQSMIDSIHKNRRMPRIGMMNLKWKPTTTTTNDLVKCRTSTNTKPIIDDNGMTTTPKCTTTTTTTVTTRRTNDHHHQLIGRHRRIKSNKRFHCTSPLSVSVLTSTPSISNRWWSCILVMFLLPNAINSLRVPYRYPHYPLFHKEFLQGSSGRLLLATHKNRLSFLFSRTSLPLLYP